jgi:hypothetical protein
MCINQLLKCSRTTFYAEATNCRMWWNQKGFVGKLLCSSQCTLSAYAWRENHVKTSVRIPSVEPSTTRIQVYSITSKPACSVPEPGTLGNCKDPLLLAISCIFCHWETEDIRLPDLGLEIINCPCRHQLHTRSAYAQLRKRSTASKDRQRSTNMTNVSCSALRRSWHLVINIHASQ